MQTYGKREPFTKEMLSTMLHRDAKRPFSGNPFTGYAIVHERDQKIIGRISIGESGEPGISQSGLLLHEHYRGKGLGTEAICLIAALAKHLFEKQYTIQGEPVRQFTATVLKANEQSKRLLARFMQFKEDLPKKESEDPRSLYVAEGEHLAAFTKQLGAITYRKIEILPPGTYLSRLLAENPPNKSLGDPTDQLKVGEFTAQSWCPLPATIVNRIWGLSWDRNCPVSLKDLAYIQVTHWTMQGEVQVGELIVHGKLAREILEIFLEIFKARFPIQKMVLISDYGADDDRSMEDNNSSAFCSRSITGDDSRFSEHSYGGAIDLNPKENPYIKNGKVLPPQGRAHLDRTKAAAGKILKGGPVFTIFAGRGYEWGGDWQSLKDYMHVQKPRHLFIEEAAS